MEKRMKRFGFIALLILTVFCSRSTWALTSSYYDGRVYFNESQERVGEGVAGWIDFAVYDTEFSTEHVDNGIVKQEGWDRYIYAYQIEQFDNSILDITEFSVLDKWGDPLDESLINNTGAQDDGDGGIEPLPSDTQGVWTWSFEDGSGYIAQGEHSWLLVFTSKENVDTGTFEIKSSGIPAPVPEPTTIAILGLGSVMLTVRHRKKSRV
jgi:hypothetical protein